MRRSRRSTIAPVGAPAGVPLHVRVVAFVRSTPPRPCTVLLALGGMIGTPHAAALAQREVECRGSLSAPVTRLTQGARIRRLTVQTAAPALAAPLTRAATLLHTRTRPEVIRRQLLFRVGDSLDTLAIAESMYRLRHTGYLAAARVVERRCSDSSGVALTVETRDAWSAQATVVVRANGSDAVGLRDRNLGGTGRDVGIVVRTDANRVGIGAAYRDAWLAGGRAAGGATITRYADGSEAGGQLTSLERSIFDRWHASLTASQSLRYGRAPASPDTLHRRRAQALVSRTVRAAGGIADAVVVGAEAEQTRMQIADSVRLVGPASIRRDFVGIDIGARRRSARYASVPWMLPTANDADVPLGTEGDVIVGLGHDRHTTGVMLHPDLWIGRVWQPSSGALVVGDAWVSGYAARSGWSGATQRLSLTLFHSAPRGLWTFRAAGEALIDPDPNVRALATLDQAIGALPRRSRLAESAVTIGLERTRHLARPHLGYVLDAALFSAASLRDDPNVVPVGRLGVLALGGGLRLTPVRLGRATLRLDVGYPVARTAGVQQGPFVAFTIVPWFESDRGRSLTAGSAGGW